jgi:hypothetical protein
MAVVAMMEQGGEVRAIYMKRLTAKDLHGEIINNVSPPAIIITDDFKSYIRLFSSR